MQKSETYHWESIACKRCPQFSGSNVVRATPCREGGILVVGEAPGTDENRERKGFIGEAGTTSTSNPNSTSSFKNDFLTP